MPLLPIVTFMELCVHGRWGWVSHPHLSWAESCLMGTAVMCCLNITGTCSRFLVFLHLLLRATFSERGKYKSSNKDSIWIKSPPFLCPLDETHSSLPFFSLCLCVPQKDFLAVVHGRNLLDAVILMLFLLPPVSLLRTTTGVFGDQLLNELHTFELLCHCQLLMGP